MRVIANAYYQYHQGLLDFEAWTGYSAHILGHLGPGSVAEPYWERVSPSYPERFVDEVTRILEWAKLRGDRPVTENRAEFIAMLENK